MRLLVDEYGVGIGSRGVSLARAVLYFSQGRACTISAPSVGSTVAQGRWNNNSSRAPTSGGGGGRVPQGKVRSLPLLGRLLRHQEVLEETDKERYTPEMKSLYLVIYNDWPANIYLLLLRRYLGRVVDLFSPAVFLRLWPASISNISLPRYYKGVVGRTLSIRY